MPSGKACRLALGLSLVLGLVLFSLTLIPKPIHVSIKGQPSVIVAHPYATIYSLTETKSKMGTQYKHWHSLVAGPGFEFPDDVARWRQAMVHGRMGADSDPDPDPDSILVERMERLDIQAGSFTPASASTVVPQAQIKSYNMSYAVIMVEYEGGSPSNFTRAGLADQIWTNPNSADSLLNASTFGHVRIQHAPQNILGPMYISMQEYEACDYRVLMARLEEGRLGLGVDFSKFDSVIYALPELGDCSWMAMSPMLCIGTFADSDNGCYMLLRKQVSNLIAHEIGHNYGLLHAAADGDVYGDLSCTMGYSSFSMWGNRQYNAPHVDIGGWIPAANLRTPGLSSAPALNHTVSIAALEDDNPYPYPYVYRIPEGPSSGSSNYYYLSYRAPMKRDVNLQARYLNKISIHYVRNPMYQGAGETFLIAVLGDGESWQSGIDEFGDSINVTQTSHTAKSASALLRGCVANAGITVDPNIQTVNAGQLMVFNVSITNLDVGCKQASRLYTPTTNIKPAWGFGRVTFSQDLVGPVPRGESRDLVLNIETLNTTSGWFIIEASISPLFVSAFQVKVKAVSVPSPSPSSTPTPTSTSMPVPIPVPTSTPSELTSPMIISMVITACIAAAICLAVGIRAVWRWLKQSRPSAESEDAGAKSGAGGLQLTKIGSEMGSMYSPLPQ